MLLLTTTLHSTKVLATKGLQEIVLNRQGGSRSSLNNHITLHEFIAKWELPESPEELIQSKRIWITLITGETIQPNSTVHRLYEGDRVRVTGLAGHNEFTLICSDLDQQNIKTEASASQQSGPHPNHNMDSSKVVDSIKFLLNSVSKLSDRFLDSNEATRRSFEHVRQDVDDLLERLGRVETDLLNWRDQQLIAAEHSEVRQPELPVKPGQEKLAIPALNLPLDVILETYRTSPALLQPFARACSVSGRTLSGMVSEVELEVFAQGTTWIVETQDGEWLLFPRPGLGRVCKAVAALMPAGRGAPW